MLLSQTLNKLSVILLVGSLILFGCDQPTNIQEETPDKTEAEKLAEKRGESVEGEYIVVFKDTQEGKSKAKLADQQITAVMSDYQIENDDIKSRYKYSITGFTAKLSDKQLEALENDQRVDYVEPNRFVMLSPPKGSSWWLCLFFGICDDDGGGPQETPYGITRVGGPVDGTDLTAWVIDTGVDLDHDDLTVDIQRSTSFALFESSPDDGNGHGTHVAGTIAALDNDIDVVGVAAGATVVAVKVLNSLGFGTNADVIEGVDYVAANASPGDVANMSVGGGASDALDDAVRDAADAGVLFAIAAGNNSDDANNYSPARVEYTNVWTVSAIDSNDDFASFSNYGNPPIEYAAPGVDVKSLWMNNGVNTISGTSMASPHVAGVLLATGGNPGSDGTANNDPDGDPDPIVHN